MAHDDRTRPSEDDEGKNVVDSTGEKIGIVNAVEGGTLHVESDPGLTDSIKATLGWGDTEGTQTIDASHIAEITDDTIRLAADDPAATDVDTDGDVSGDETAAGATIAGDTGSGMGHEQEATTDRNDLPPEERDDDPIDGDLSGDETAAEMDDAGDLTDDRTTDEAGAGAMTDQGVSEREEGDAADEMGVPTGEDDPDPDDVGGMGGRDANERPPAAEDTPGRDDVQDAQTDAPRGEEDVQDPVPDEPRDTEDVRENAEELDPESEADPEDQPSTGEAATRGAEEDADLGRDDDDDEDDLL